MLSTIAGLLFQKACFLKQQGHIDVAKWRYSLGQVNIHAGNEYTFKCYPKEVKKWLNLIRKN